MHLRRAAVVLVAAATLTGCAGLPSTAGVAPASVDTPGVTEVTAAEALNQLPVKGRAAMTGYSRKQFGSGWADPDGNGCDARRDVLARQAVGVPERRGKAACVFVATVRDPYTGKDIPSTDADIDHVVALGDAWVTGAQQISAAQREALANDPLNLLAVTSSVNRQKGDSDAATWLPPLKAARCSYVARQVAVKTAYGLWVTPPEHDAMARVLGTCPAEGLPR
jgi:hypothetical protein